MTTSEMLDVNSIIKDFPLLEQEFNGKKIVYFDNACMSLRPRQVLEAMDKYYTEFSACAGRSNHRLATKVNEEVEKARESIGKLINANRKEEVIFVRNTSEGLNLVAHSLGLKKGDVVVTTDKEHNSNLVPWLKLRDGVGIEYRIVRSREDNTFDLEALDEVLDERVKLVSVVWASNMDGVSNPMEDIIKKAHDVGALVMVDAAQAAPHQEVDVKKLDVDLLAFSGHKMLGPSGMGVLYGKYDLLDKMDTFMVGGDTVVGTTYESYEMLPLPEKYEAGLQDYAGMIGFGRAAEYLMEIGLNEIHEHEVKLNRLLSDGIRDIDRLKIIGPAEAKKRGGIVSFTVERVDVHQISLMMDEMSSVMIRSGQHCVHSWFEDRGIKGSARASLYLYNTEEEVEVFVDSLKKVLQVV